MPNIGMQHTMLGDAMTDKTEAQPEALRLAEWLEALAKGNDVGQPKLLARAAARELLRQHAEIQQLKAAQKELREEQRLCMLEASGLANSMFKKHFSHERHYASDEVVWGLCDSVRGVISQIDNMASGLVRPEAQLSARQAAPDGQWKCGDEFLPYHPDASHVDPAYRDGWNDCYRSAPRPPDRESLLPDFPVANRRSPTCGCETCRPNTLSDMRFIVCPDCGNKRCPKATHHDNACTNSNAPGQPGSSWEHVKPHGATND